MNAIKILRHALAKRNESKQTYHLSSHFDRGIEGDFICSLTLVLIDKLGLSADDGKSLFPLGYAAP